MDISFYHLTRTTLEAALPQMLEKTLERGQRAVVRAGSAERVEALNGWLWTYRDRTFLPHGSAQDGHAALQPVWLTDQDERPNEAQVLFLTGRAPSGAGDVRRPDLRGPPDLQGSVCGSSQRIVAAALGRIWAGGNGTVDHGGGRLDSRSRRALGALTLAVPRRVSVIVHVFSPLFSE